MNEFIITFRETLESTLIVGIVYTSLFNTNNQKNIKALWIGVVAAILASIVFAFAISSAEEVIGEAAEAYTHLFEAVMMYVAAAFLIYMVSWMVKNTGIKQKLERETQNAGAGAVIGIVFFGIVREGFETVLFLSASKNMTNGLSYVGGFAGIVVAILAGWLLFARGKRVPIKKFFTVSSLVLIFFAAGMVAYGTHEMEEYFEESHNLGFFGLEDKKLPDGTELEAEDQIARPYSILEPLKTAPTGTSAMFYTEKDGKYFHILHDKGSIGVFLKGFLGYNSDPNWIEFILWQLTFWGAFYLWRKNSVAPAPTQKQTA